MALFRIIQTASGVDFGRWEGATKEEALDAYAKAAGYSDFASIPAEIGGGETLMVKKCRDETEDNPFDPESPEGRAWDRGDRSSVEP